MAKKMDRRKFLGVTASTTLGLAAGAAQVKRAYAGETPVRLAVIGTGRRGSSLLSLLVGFPGVEIPAICDINADAANTAAETVTKAGRPSPEKYTKNETIYQEVLNRGDIDAVIIATPWNWHTPMAVDAMKAGKYVGVEVPAALTMAECWALVNTSEETGIPCMMLENWSFRRDNLAVLNMIRQGLFGGMVHCHCAHSHDCIDHWFFDTEGNMRWSGEFLVRRNCDQYPTHSEGPVLSWLDINCGDAYATLTSTASASTGINAYFARKFGPDHPNAKRTYAQGDIVTSVIKTHLGKTIVINYDMQLPRPYDNRWMVQGTLGIYNEQRNSVYITGHSPKYHEWESFDPYQEQFDHAWWKEMTQEAGSQSHGGTDYLELKLFIKAVREKTQTPIDVYDSATMSSVVALSEESIAKGSAPVVCPDFTRGAWKSRKPVFGVVA